MSIESDIFTQFTAFPALATMIVSGGEKRLYPQPPGGIPQRATRPAVTYQRISTPRNYTAQGRAALAGSRFQFNCYGRNQLESETLANVVMHAADAFTMPTFVDGPRDLSDPDTKTTFPALDVMFYFQEA